MKKYYLASQYCAQYFLIIPDVSIERFVSINDLKKNNQAVRQLPMTNNDFDNGYKFYNDICIYQVINKIDPPI